MAKRFSTMLQLFTVAMAAILVSSCATVNGAFSSAGTRRRPAEDLASSGMSSRQISLIDSAYWALGRRNLKVDGKTFNMDCSGVVLAIYYKSGMDLSAGLGRYRGGGVERLHSRLKDLELLYETDYPVPGDLLFWDNTYDRNGDGQINDGLTHIGMVVRTDDKGNVEYIHHNYRKGIVLASMNLLEPDNVNLNSPIRARNIEKGHVSKWLSSHLLRDVGKAYELP